MGIYLKQPKEIPQCSKPGSKNTEETAMCGISRRLFLSLSAPTGEDQASDQLRILRALRERGYEAVMPVQIMRRLYPLCEEAGWELTVSLAYDGNVWQILEVEEGNREAEHYGLAVDLGSTSVVMRLHDCRTGKVLGQESVYNRQIAFGEDILTRIFYARNQPEHLEELRRATVETLTELMGLLEQKTGIDVKKSLSMVIAGNTTMLHFLIGMDAFCVFSSPYAVHADQPGFLPAADLEIPMTGYVYCYPGKANYLGGDILSGLVAAGLHRRDSLSLFFDVGTNGELVIGCRDFLVCGAGAAGPALEGGVVKTGMRAADGAVSRVRLAGGAFETEVIGGGRPCGICGSGIVDLISELFLNGWVDLRGRLNPEASALIAWKAQEEEYAVCYAPGLWFYQSDLTEFIRTKAAAYTMMEYIMTEVGLSLDDIQDFYMAGAFGAHIDRESAVNIGMYPDVELSRIHAAGNTSLEGASMLLLDLGILDELEEILELMHYVQFGAVEDFVEKMTAASALPHTDLNRYPSVVRRLCSRESY